MITRKKHLLMRLLALLIVGSLILPACSESTPEVVEKTKAVEVEKASTATPEPTATSEPTVEPTPEGPPVGGTLAWLQAEGEPSTLDAHKVAEETATTILQLVGGTLIARDQNGDFVPYLAQAWEISDDGLVWTFSLKKGVKFHDGTELTAHDYAWTFQRILDPETAALTAASLIGSVTTVEAVDDYTLQFTLAEPFFPFLLNLTHPYLMPLSQAAVEERGDQYGRHPVGVGPYKFKEWRTSEKIVLERNPDFNWGPDYHPGPFYVETIEFPILFESAIMLAALETGDVDLSYVQGKDMDRIQELEQFQIFELPRTGLGPYVALNVGQPPFDDVLVRRAFNLAADPEPMIKAVAGGYGSPAYGPGASSTSGYWPGVEELGYGYDLEQARALLLEAGYSAGSDGMLEKDGESFELTLKTAPFEEWVKIGEILVEQYEVLGVKITIEQQDPGIFLEALFSGDFEFAMMGFGADDIDVLHNYYHSVNIGGENFVQLADSELDEMLDETRRVTDPGERQEWANAAQKHMVEQAYLIPLYTPISFFAVSNRVKGAVWPLASGRLYIDDAYIEDGR